jgi:hypothetical protein
VSTTYSKTAFCGEITYELYQTNDLGTRSTVPTFITNNKASVTIAPTSNAHLGDKKILLLAYLTDYPEVQLEEVFDVSVDYCIPVLTKVTTITSFTYQLTDDATITSFPTYTQTPACGFNIYYSLERQDGTTLDDVFTVGTTSFEVFANESYDQLDTYPLKVTASVGPNSSIIRATDPVNFSVVIATDDDCILNEMIDFDPTVSVSYIIGRTAEVADPEWEYQSGCPLDFVLTQEDMPNGTYDTDIFTLSGTGTVSVFTQSQDYDLDNIELTLTATVP